MKMNPITWAEAREKLSAGELVVIPTDTLYGLVGSAMKPETVEKIYHLRQRETGKPLITLISKLEDLDRFQIKIDDRTHEMFTKIWPGPVSAIVPVPAPELAYIHRGTKSIAFRMPAKEALLELLRATGPLVAPSANLAGENPASTFDEAYEYFGDAVYYVDEGTLNGAASALVDVRGDRPRVLRPAPGFDVTALG